MKPFFSLLFLTGLLVSCSSNADTGDQEIESSAFAYADYQIWAEEGRDEVTIRVQYRQGGKEGEAIALQEPSKVLLDGSALTAGSTKFMGTFYEVSKPTETFKGKHFLVFVDEAGKEHTEEFSFRPFTLAGELPENIKKQPFQIVLKGFPEEPTTIRLVMTDTSHVSEDVNEEVVVENGQVDITADDLANLTKGPVSLEIYREEEKALRKNPQNRGRFTMTYGLKRQFTLVE